MAAVEVPLEEVISHLQAEYDFLFSFVENDIQHIKVTPPKEEKSVQDFLSYILKNQNLDFEIVASNYIIFSKKEISLKDQEDVKVLLCGSIFDALSDTPLPFANVYLERSKQGTAAEEDGTFELNISIEPTDMIVISFVGYEEKKLLASTFIKKPCQKILLENATLHEDMIVIVDYLTDGIDLDNNGAFNRLQPKRIGALPGQIEPDVMRTIQFLPGVNSSDGSAESIHIRGGTPDQNLILWEGIPIYHSAHYFGMLSAFNPYIIEEMNVHRGGFDADYGGRISGVIDMKSEDYSISKNNLGVGSNFVNTFINGEFSLLEGDASLVFSARRSISDLVNTPTFNNISARVHQGVLFEPLSLNQAPKNVRVIENFNYFDTNLKFSYKISDKDKVEFASFYNINDFESTVTDDNGDRSQRDNLFLTSSGGTFSWSHQWNKNLSTKATALFTDYEYDYKYSVEFLTGGFVDKEGKKRSGISERQINIANSYLFQNNANVKLGYQLTDYDVGFSIERTLQNNQEQETRNQGDSKLHVIYTSFESDNSKAFGINLGVRANFFEKEKSTYIEPRLRLWYRINDHWKIYGNTGRYVQFLSQVIEVAGDQSTIDIPVWSLNGIQQVPILSSYQHQLGVLLDKNNWVFDVQVYSKNINGLTSLATNFNIEILGQYNLGKAEIRGIDFLLKKRWKNYQTWMSYSRIDMTHIFPTFFDTEFVPATHIPHKFHWVHILRKNNFEFSLGWKIASGTPYSSIQNFNLIENTTNMGPKVIINPKNNIYNDRRVDASHQLDASFSYTLPSNEKRKWKGTFGISLFNIYHQRNIYQRAFFLENPPNDDPRIIYSNKTDLGFTPNVLVKFDW